MSNQIIHLSQTPQISLQERFRGMILGIAVGDALGAPVEMKSTRRIRKMFKGPIKDLHPCRGQKEAGWTTDDTALSVCMAESLAEHGSYDPENAFSYYLHWFFLDGKGMGSNTKFVFKSADEGMDPRLAAELFSYLRPGRAVSNGGLMRTAPLGAFYHTDPVQMEQASRIDASMTHYDSLSAEACVAYNFILKDLLEGKEPSFQSDVPVVEASLKASKSVARDLITNGRGMVLVSLAGAAWAAREAKDLEHGIIEVVNWGGDADSNAAIAGGLLGAKFGPDSIPKRWLDKLQEREYFVELADRLFQAHQSFQAS